MRVYNKLVRDNIPKIIADNGEKANTYILDDEQYIIELKKKLPIVFDDIIVGE